MREPYSCVITSKAVLREEGYWVITSNDLPGMLLSGKDLHKLVIDIPNVIKVLFKKNFGADVNVLKTISPSEIKKKPLEESIEPSSQWTTVPVEV